MTALLHTPAELTLASCDDVAGIVTFIARSVSDPARINTVELDTTDGAVICDCKGAEFGRRYWHMDLVAAVWERTSSATAARMLSAVALHNKERNVAAMIAADRARG